MIAVEQLFESVIALAEHANRGNSIVLRTRLAANLPPIEGDPEQLTQVLLNLTINAMQAMPEGRGNPPFYSSGGSVCCDRSAGSRRRRRGWRLGANFRPVLYHEGERNRSGAGGCPSDNSAARRSLDRTEKPRSWNDVFRSDAARPQEGAMTRRRVLVVDDDDELAACHAGPTGASRL